MKKVFYNYDKMDLERRKSYKKVVFNLNVPNFYGMEFFQEIDKKIIEFINELDKNEPTVIQIVGDFSLVKNEEPADIEDFLTSIVALFISAIHIKTEKSDREHRLAVPQKLANINLPYTSKLKIINYKLRLPIFTIEILNEKQEILLKIF